MSSPVRRLATSSWVSFAFFLAWKSWEVTGISSSRKTPPPNLLFDSLIVSCLFPLVEGISGDVRGVVVAIFVANVEQAPTWKL
jgi:hypothetical protein